MSGAPKKSSPISLRLDDGVYRDLVDRARELGVSPGVLARSMVNLALRSDLDAQLEAIRTELAALLTRLSLLRADLHQLNNNLADSLRAVLSVLIENDETARDLAEEVVKPLGGED